MALTERWETNDHSQLGQAGVQDRDGAAMSVNPSHGPSEFEPLPGSATPPAPAATAPAPPAGQGSALAWFESSQRSAIIGAVGIFVIAIVGVIFVQGFSAVWMGYWQPWLALFVVAALFYFFRRRTAVSAGAEWLQR